MKTVPKTIGALGVCLALVGGCDSEKDKKKKDQEETFQLQKAEDLSESARMLLGAWRTPEMRGDEGSAWLTFDFKLNKLKVIVECAAATGSGGARQPSLRAWGEARLTILDGAFKSFDRLEGEDSDDKIICSLDFPPLVGKYSVAGNGLKLQIGEAVLNMRKVTEDQGPSGDVNPGGGAEEDEENEDPPSDDAGPEEENPGNENPEGEEPFKFGVFAL